MDYEYYMKTFEELLKQEKYDEMIIKLEDVNIRTWFILNYMCMVNDKIIREHMVKFIEMYQNSILKEHYDLSSKYIELSTKIQKIKKECGYYNEELGEKLEYINSEYNKCLRFLNDKLCLVNVFV